jgi:predicted RNA binding protein YcfA (HicA-like mRNA interferase family)
MQKFLEKNGYELVDGGKGSHQKYKKAGAPTIILPANRGDLSPVVTRNTLKALGYDSLRDLPGLLTR